MEGLFGQRNYNDNLGSLNLDDSRLKLGVRQRKDLDDFRSMPIQALENPREGWQQQSQPNPYSVLDQDNLMLAQKQQSPDDLFGLGARSATPAPAPAASSPYGDQFIANPFKNPLGDFNPFGGSSSSSSSSEQKIAGDTPGVVPEASRSAPATPLAPDMHGSVRDTVTVTVCWLVRLVRAMVIWIIIHFVDKYYQAQYLKSTSLGLQLPRLWTLPLFVLAIEGGVFATLICITFAMSCVYKRDFNTFVLDRPLIKLLIKQYVFSTAPAAAAGVLIARVLQHSRALRYAEDGARAIRATSLMFFYVAVIAVSLPVDTW